MDHLESMQRKETQVKRILVALWGLVISMGPLTANAVPVLIDITPSPGSAWVMTGSFDLDPGTSTYSNLTVNLTWAAGPGFNNTPCDGCALSGSTVGLIDTTLTQTTFLQDFTVTFGGGVLDAIFRGNSFYLQSSSGRFDGTYQFKPLSVSEPSTLAVLGLGLFAMGLMRRRFA